MVDRRTVIIFGQWGAISQINKSPPQKGYTVVGGIFKRKPTTQAANCGATRCLVDIEEVSSWPRSRVIVQGIKADTGLSEFVW